ncbi:MAG: DUF2169 domain-containing protein [Polyangiaceae bacterium]
MLLINRTPLHSAIVPNADDDDGIVALFLVSATFNLLADPLRFAVEQRPLQLIPHPPEVGDHYLTKAGASVTATGHVYAPNGLAPAAEAKLAVGDRVLSVAAFGRRVWREDPSGAIVATAATPFDRLPMTWENAYGGAVIAPARLLKNELGEEAILPEHPEAFVENTDGIGFYTEAPGAIGEPLPHLEDPDRLIRKWDDRPDPVCFAPYPMYGGMRARYVADKGVVDFSRHPHLLSRAAPLTTFSEVPPGTRIALSGMRAGQQILSFEVPRAPVLVDALIGDRHRRLDLYVDAVDIDADAAEARVVYRALFSYPLVRYEIRSLHVRPHPDLEKLLP